VKLNHSRHLDYYAGDVADSAKVHQRTEMEVELEHWKMRAITAEAKLDKIRALMDKYFGGDGRK
jgi:hypothetical protein